MQLKNVLKEYIEEYNKKIINMIKSIDAEILINKNILKIIKRI